MSGYFFMVSNLEKCGNLWKNGRFSRRIWPDWGYHMGGFGRIGVHRVQNTIYFDKIQYNIMVHGVED